MPLNFGSTNAGILKDNYGESPLIDALRKRREKLSLHKIGLIDPDDTGKDTEIDDLTNFGDRKSRRL